MDIQLLAIAALIILVVIILVSCFLFVGTRERTFEDALAEQQGLNLLLSKDGADSTTGHKKQQKDVKKKKSAVKEPPKKEKKPEEKEKSKKDATPISSTPTPSTSIDGRTAEEEEAVVAVDHDEPAHHNDEHANQKDTSKKGGKKRSKNKKRTLSGNETDGSDAHAASAEDVQVHEEHPQDPAVVSPAAEELVTQQHVTPDNQAADEPAHQVESLKKPKKNKSKSTKRNESGESGIKLEEKPFAEDSSINSLLDKLKLPLLSDMQVDVISSYYSKIGEWSTAHSKPDPVITMKKQLDEKEQLLSQEIQMASAAKQKLTEIKQEIAKEKQRYASTELSFKEQMTLKQSENQNLAQKLRDTQNQMTVKMQSYRQMEAQLMQYRSAIEQANPAQLQQVREENQRLKERISSYDQEILTRNSDVQRMKQDLMTRENQIHRLEQRAMHEAGVNQQLADSQTKLMQKEKECLQLADELNNLRQEWSLLEQNVGLLRKQLSERELNEDARYKGLENALNAKNKLDVDVQTLKNDLDSTMKKLQQYEQVEKDLRNELQMAVLARKSAEAAAENLKIELSSSNNNTDVSELQQHVAVLESTVVGRDNTVTKLEDELKDLQQHTTDYESQLNAMRKQIEELTNENHVQFQRFQTVNNENAKLSDQIRIQQAVNGHSEVASVIIDPDVLKVNERSMAQLNKQLINKDGEIAHLKEQLEILRQKNIELRDKKYKAVESVQQMEKNTKELIDKIEDKCQKEMHQKEKILRDTLVKCTSGCPSNENMTFYEWLHEYERVVKNIPVAVEPIVVKHVSPTPDVSEVRIKLDEMSKDNLSLHSQLSTYKSVLAQTEGLLKNLERNAVEDENKWRQKFSILEAQLNEALQQTSSQQLQTSTEDTRQIENLKHSLEKEKIERETIFKELTLREKDLETERVTGRDLSAQAVKLRGMLKTGQDALNAEQALVSQLQKQLATLQDDKGGRTVHDELEDLRNKLSQRESQLEKEIMINKQLNNKLASLGVAAVPTFSS